MKLSFLKTTLLLLSFSHTVLGQSFSFLNQRYAPRINALAGATVADKKDMNNVLINPASLALVEKNQCAVSLTKHLLDFKSGMAACLYHNDRFGNLALGFLFFDFGDFEEIDRYAMYTGRTFNAREIALIASYAIHINEYFSIGNTIKCGCSMMDYFEANFIACDLGVIIEPPVVEGLCLGLSITNLGSNYDYYNNVTEELPTNLNIGVSKEIGKYQIMLYLAYQKVISSGLFNLQPQDGLTAGVECEPYKGIKIRLGYHNIHSHNLSKSSKFELPGLSLGFGLRFKSNRLDYCYRDYGDLGSINQFGISLNLPTLFSKQNIKEPIDSASINKLALLNYELTADSLILRWPLVHSALFNVYGKYADVEQWTKLASEPLTENSITFNRPTKPGSYQFYVTQVIEDNEQDFSEILTIEIQ